MLDEGVIEASIAILGHRGDDVEQGWEAIRLELAPTGNAGKTEDAEACDFFGEHLYVLGSHFGKKDGPLEAKRAWIARVAAADLAAAADGASPPIEIARNRFGLHRALNDHLAGLDLRALGPRARENLVLATIERGASEGQELGGEDPRRRPADQHRGLLLPRGRHAAARPALAGDRRRLADPRRAAQPRGLLRRSRLAAGARRGLDALVRRRAREPDGRARAGPHGATAACTRSPAASTRSARTRRSCSTTRAPGKAHCEHWTFTLPEGGGAVECVKTHEFPDERSVEGLAKMPSGPFLYVVDRDDNVHLRFLMTEEES